MNQTAGNIVSIENFFKTRGYVPGGMITNSRMESLDLEAVPAFLRTLLVTDGTVTKCLEAYFWEPVQVENLGQNQITVAQDIDWLDLKQGSPALFREVRLRGAESGNVYTYAKSILKLDLLPQQLKDDLLRGDIGIGEMLRERGLETYRELLDIGREFDESLVPIFDTKRCGELIYRTYRVVMNHVPAMLITEKFRYRLYNR